MKHIGLEFAERLIPLDTPEFTRDIATISPTKRVPVLLHGGLTVWATVLADAHMRPWLAAAAAESWSIEASEIGRVESKR